MLKFHRQFAVFPGQASAKIKSKDRQVVLWSKVPHLTKNAYAMIQSQTTQRLILVQFRIIMAIETTEGIIQFHQPCQAGGKPYPLPSSKNYRKVYYQPMLLSNVPM